MLFKKPNRRQLDQNAQMLEFGVVGIELSNRRPPPTDGAQRFRAIGRRGQPVDGPIGSSVVPESAPRLSTFRLSVRPFLPSLISSLSIRKTVVLPFTGPTRRVPFVPIGSSAKSDRRHYLPSPCHVRTRVEEIENVRFGPAQELHRRGRRHRRLREYVSTAPPTFRFFCRSPIFARSRDGRLRSPSLLCRSPVSRAPFTLDPAVRLVQGFCAV